MTEQQSQNLLLKVDPLSAIRNKFITQGEKLETAIAKVRVFVSNISSLLPPPQALRFSRKEDEATRNWGRAREGSWEGERREAKRLQEFGRFLANFVVFLPRYFSQVY